MLVVELIEVRLKFFKLLDHLVFTLNVRLHLALFQLKSLLIDTLLGVQFGDLRLPILCQVLCLAQFFRDTLHTLLHLTDEFLQLLDLLEGQFLLRDFLATDITLLFNLILQERNLVTKFGCLRELTVELPLQDPLSIVLQSFLLMHSLCFELLLAKVSLYVANLVLHGQ